MSKIESNLINALTLGQVLTTIPSGLFLVDLDQIIVHWNDEAQRITGYSAAEAIGRHCSFLEGVECGNHCGLYNPEIKKPIIGANCSIRTKDGKLIQLIKNVDYLRHEGAIIGGVESFIDVTSQKQLEQQLRHSAELLEAKVASRTLELETERSRLNTLLEAMDDPTYITRPDYTISYTNRAQREIFGTVDGEICYRVLYHRDTPCPNCPMTKIHDGETFREERFCPVNQRTFEVLHTPIADEQGQTLKLAVCRDITERKLAEQALLNANRELDAFVHTVSHDLRSPLTPIIGYTELLLSEFSDQIGPQIREMIKDIEQQGHRMLNIMEDLLEMARVGQLELPAERISSQEVLQEVLEEFLPRIHGQKIQLEIGQLPEVRLPDTLLHQLFGNLIGNALNYGCATGSKLEVGGQRQGTTVLFYVRDFGQGIPEDEREKVFEIFTRGSNSTKQKGTGIGLATVRKIARLLNGRAWIEETPGGGCTIKIELVDEP